jgi:maltooligosyltrehalose trehalohydrolase
MRAQFPDPADIATFEQTKLDLSEHERHAETYALDTDLLAIRREDKVLPVSGWGGLTARCSPSRHSCSATPAGTRTTACSSSTSAASCRSIRLPSHRSPHPPARAGKSSEDPRYGGFGTPQVEGEESWHLPGESAIVMRPEREGETDG